jgi:hypothetical protein
MIEHRFKYNDNIMIIQYVSNEHLVYIIYIPNLAVPIKQKALNSNKKLNITRNLLFSCFIFWFQKIIDF